MPAISFVFKALYITNQNHLKKELDGLENYPPYTGNYSTNTSVATKFHTPLSDCSTEIYHIFDGSAYESCFVNKHYVVLQYLLSHTISIFFFLC